jgi:preprotein translocase subunit SecA
MTAPLRLPPIVAYAERREHEDTAIDRWAAAIRVGLSARATGLRVLLLRPILHQMTQYTERFAAMDDAALRAEVPGLSLRLRMALDGHRLPVAAAGEAFAFVREAADRILGMRPYDVQALGAWAMMRGEIAEMRTGEGKTLAAALATATTALSGRQVHVMTVNDYLANRDADTLRPLYEFLGLTLGVVVQGQDATVRRHAYRCDIVYGNNTEIAFDFLRDRANLRRAPGNLRRKIARLTPAAKEEEALRLPGLPVAIIDEADSVLIDEARTPLIISGHGALPGASEIEVFQAALDAAREMVEGAHFRIPRGTRRVEVLDAGFDWLDDLTLDRHDGFGIPVIRDHAVHQALNALHVFQSGDAYVVRHGKVHIVDENTGRMMPDRQWSDGLHQLIELKEGLETTPARETLSRMTYQRFFRRYSHVGGMTGTARDAAWELGMVYRLAVTRIPTHRPDRRRFVPDRAFLRASDKLDAIAARVAELHRAGRPVLIGTRSINASEAVADRLEAAGLPFRLLSATQDADEAAIVAEAGQPGRITVATNMAGRGTDIKLADGVAAVGGLHVILTERHDSRRVDRQMEGRCGRQGDPGQVEAFLSLEDELVSGPGTARLRAVATAAVRLFGPAAAGWAIRLRQRQVERSQARSRRDLMDQDRDLGDLLAFSGELE